MLLKVRAGRQPISRMLMARFQTHVTLRCEVVGIFFAAADAFVITVCSVATCVLYHRIAGLPVPDLLISLALGLTSSFVYITRLGYSGHYSFQQVNKPEVEFRMLVIGWAAAALLCASLAFMVKSAIPLSRGSFLAFAMTTPVILAVLRKCGKHLLDAAITSGNIGRRNVAVIGSRPEIEALHERDLLASFGASQARRFVFDSDTRDVVLSEANTLDQLTNYLRSRDAHEILVALPWHDTRRIALIRETVKTLPVWVKLLPDLNIQALTNCELLAKKQTLTVELQRPPLRATERLLKRAMDVVLGTIGLVLLSPLMLCASIAIKLDSSGPVIFKQHRRGFKGQHFLMLKFRSMSVQEGGNSGELVTQAARNDERVTRIGRILRASSIDELP
jgi:hypothetical protein